MTKIKYIDFRWPERIEESVSDEVQAVLCSNNETV